MATIAMTSTITDDTAPLTQHIALSEDEKPAISPEAQYNVDENGWALIESYV